MQALRDQNHVTTLIAASATDGTPVAIMADPFTHVLETTGNTTPISASSTAPRDQNHIPTVLGVSSVDHITPVVICANPTTQKIFLKFI